MTKLRFHILLWVIVLGLSACTNTIFFKPRLSCEYKPNYGLVFVSRDTLSRLFMNYVDFYELDTQRFLINSYEKYTLFYLPDYLALGFIDTSRVLQINDFNGSELFSIQLPWDFRMLEYITKKGILVGVIFDTTDNTYRIALLSVTNGSLIFTQAIDEQYQIDTQQYFLDRINNIYYIGVKSGDSLYLLGWSINERKFISKANLDYKYIRPEYNFLTQLAVGLVNNSGTYTIVSFSPQTGEQKSTAELALTELSDVIGFDQSRQNLVIGSLTDTSYNFTFYHVDNGKISEIHSFAPNPVEDVEVWSSMDNKILKSE